MRRHQAAVTLAGGRLTRRLLKLGIKPDRGKANAAKAIDKKQTSTENIVQINCEDHLPVNGFESNG